MSKTDKKTATKTDNIEKMDFSQLRKTVRLLYDELSLFKRKYNDAIMNLDEGNFGKSLTFTQNRMKSQIKMNAKAISTKVSADDVDGKLESYSTIEQTASQIQTAVISINNTTDTKLENYSTLEQTAEAITTTVTAEYVNSLIGGGYVTNAVMMSQIQQSAEQIMLSVSTDYETKDTANDVYEQLRSDITVNSEQIQLKVSETDVDTKLTNYSTLEQTATDISAAVSTERTYVTNLLGTDYYTQEQVDNLISVNADGIILEVASTYQTIDAADDDYSYLSGRITTTNNKVSAIVSGDYTEDLLSGYLTGIEITPHQIKMIDDSVYSIYNSDGLRFYDSANQIEGWSIEPSSSYGGVLNYYVNDGNCYRFGTGMNGSGYSYTDMTLKALNGQRGGFIVDVTSSSNSTVKFVGVSESGDTKYIYVNGQLLATQDWVLANAGSGGGGTATAVFG